MILPFFYAATMLVVTHAHAHDNLGALPNTENILYLPIFLILIGPLLLFFRQTGAPGYFTSPLAVTLSAAAAWKLASFFTTAALALFGLTGGLSFIAIPVLLIFGSLVSVIWTKRRWRR